MLLTTRNSVRVAVNFAKTQSFALARGVCQFSIRAYDSTSKNKPDLSLAEKTDLLGMLDNQTSDLPGILPLVVNMPMIIKTNIDTELGVCNGTMAFLSWVVLDEHELRPGENTDYVAPGAICHFKCMPKCVIVRIPMSSDELNTFPQFPGLDHGEFLVYPMTKTFQYFTKLNGVKTSKTIYRRQFPLLPGWAMTGYCAQGKTFTRAIIDLATCTGRYAGKANPADAYVLLSRVKSLLGVALLRPFDKMVLRSPPCASLKTGIKRLQTLEQNTLAKPLSVLDS